MNRDPASFTFAQMTDSHLYYRVRAADADTADAFLRRAVAEVVARGVDFIVHTGDLAGYSVLGLEAGHRRFRSLWTELERTHRVPVYFVRGNHELGLADNLYRDIYGDSTWCRVHKGWAFVALDRYDQAYEHAPDYWDMNGATLDRLDTFLTGLPATMPKVLLLHENPVGVTRFPRGPEVLHRFAGCNLRLVLYGHVQANVVSVYNGIPHVTVTGDDLAHDSSPLSYLLVHCDGDRARCRILPHLAGGDQSTPPLRAPMPGAPRLTWSARVGAGMSVGAPAPHGARLLVGLRSTGGLDECAIVAVEAATGDVAWRQPVDGSVEGGLLVRDDAAYCGTQSGSVYCLDAHTGAVRWQWNNREHLPFAGCPIWDEGRLHLGANWEMYALDAATGRALWRTLATRAGVSYFAPGHAAALVLGERVFHNRHFNARAKTLLQSVDKVTGRDFQAGPPNDFHPQWRHATPVEWNDRILHVADGLYLLDPARLEAPVWYVPHGPGSAAPALAGAVAHVSYHDEIVAHDLIHDGAILWRVPHESSLAHFNGNPWSKYGRGQPLGAFAAPLVVGDALLVTDTGGRCRCLRRQDGAELWRLGVHAPLLAPPLVWGARLLLADYAGQLHAYEWPNP